MKAHNRNKDKDKTNLCFLLLCAVSLVCSCSREDDLSVDSEPVEATFSGSFVREEWSDSGRDDSCRAATRVSDGKWTVGDAVGVYMVPGSSYALAGAVWKNRKQVIDSNNKMIPDGVANKLYYPLNGSAVRFVAYYPYAASASETATLNKVSVDFTDQSTKAKKEAKDFMFHRGTEDYSKAKPGASLGFSHKFSKIWITVNRGSGGPSVKDVAVTLSKMPQSATVDLNKLAQQQSGDITVGTQAATITAYTLSSSDATATVEAIVAPHTGTGNFSGRTFTFNAGGETKTYTLPNTVTFSSGYAYHFTFTLRETCTITYKANGGSGSDIVRTVFANDAYSLESNTFTAPSGAPFYGWNTQADGLGTDYAAGQSITPTANMTLYAQWAGVIDLATTTVPTGVSHASNTFTINSNGNYRVINSTTANRIVVKSGVTATVILSSASIDVSGTAGACAFDMAGATVTLVLEGTNTLKSGVTKAGLHVPSGANLTIAGSTGGTLTVTGGDHETANQPGIGGGAGIGGNPGSSSAGEAGGSITINSGTVIATGGKGNRNSTGAGIGGGAGAGGMGNGAVGFVGGSGGTVTINGGTVTATGGSSNGGGAGAGIGGGGGGDGYGGSTVKGGNGGAGGTVTINGGTVTATGGNGDSSSGGGAGIGGGGAGDNGASGGAAATYTGPGSATVNATGGTGEKAGANIGAGGNS